MAYSYSYIYNLPTTGLRFFTVYGPLGRPDMSLFKFTKSIIEGKKISLFNRGNHVRDFTYIDDVVISIERLLLKPSKLKIPYDIFNVGSNSPQPLIKFLKIIELYIGKKAKIKMEKLQIGDIRKTHANINKLYKKINTYQRQV